MKKFLISFVVLMLLSINNALAKEEIQFERSADKIIVDEKISGDGNKYILNNTKEVEAVTVETPKPTVFSIYNFADGYFDHHTDYTITKPVLKNMIDNDLKTSAKQTQFSGGVIKLESETEIEAYYLYGYGATAEFYYKGNRVSFAGSNNDPDKALNLVSLKLDEIRFTSGDFFSFEIIELELFEKKPVEYKPVLNLTVKNIDYQTATISFDLPNINQFVKNNIYVKKEDEAEKLVYSGVNTGYALENLKGNTNYSVRVESVYLDGKTIDAITEFSTKKYEKLQSISVSEIKETSVRFNYSLPDFADKLEIFDNENKLVATTTSVSSYTLNNLKANTTYTYKFKAVYKDSDRSNEQEVTFKTLELGREVEKLTATATAQDVSLKWELPKYEELNFVRIYRQKSDAGLFARMFRSATTYEPIFETNGTSFKDLTVKADTEYKYKVTTVDTSGNETAGEMVTIKTKKVSVSGGGTEKDENGDYVITWTSPTTGKIKVLVGGEEYAIVPASDQKIVIPKDKMKFDLIGLPDVQLIPVDEDGNEGIPSKPGGGGGIGDVVGGGSVGEIINPENLLGIVMKLLLLIAGFVLLALAFEVVPRLVKMLRQSIKNRNKSVYTRRRIEE